MIEIQLTEEQNQKLKSLFDLVNKAAAESTEKRNIRGTIHGQCFEGRATFRFFDYEQTEIVKTAILSAIEIDERKESEARLAQIKVQIAALTKERAEINAKLKPRKNGKK